MFSFGVKLDEIWNTIKVRVWPIFWINFWKWNYFLFFFFMRWADTVNSWQNEINHVRFNITWNFYQLLFSSQMTCVILVFPTVTQGLGRNSILMLVFGYKDPNVIWFSYNDIVEPWGHNVKICHFSFFWFGRKGFCGWMSKTRGPVWPSVWL